MPLEENFRVYQSFNVCLPHSTQGDYDQTTTKQLHGYHVHHKASLRNLEDQGIITPGEIFMHVHWGSTSPCVSSTSGTIVSSINTSQTFTTTKSKGISLPPTLFPRSSQIIVVVVLCWSIGSIKRTFMLIWIYICQIHNAPNCNPNQFSKFYMVGIINTWMQLSTFQIWDIELKYYN